MTHLSIVLLGGFEATLAGQPITTFAYDKVRALLAYLAVEGDHPHRRELLAGLLWPERPERRARQSLSQALLILRRTLGDYKAKLPFLIITPQTLQFNSESEHQLDVTTFTGLLAACQMHQHQRLETCQPCLERLQQAAALYRGNFLEGFSLGDSPAFEEWAVLNRERLHCLAVEALNHLANFYESGGEYEQALQYAWRQVELEPWREEGWQQLMRLLVLVGQRGTALAQYDSCRRLLLNELGVEPAPETTTLYERIRAGKWGRGVERPRASVKNFSLASQLPRSPAPSPPLVARETELAQLNKFLDLALTGQGQVVFVTGGPGWGKTVLLQAFTGNAQAAYPDLIVTTGNGNAHTGLGDPYLPFREALALLTGDIDAQYAAEAVSQEQSARLRNLLPLTIQALIETGPDLIGSFLPAEALFRRVAACGEPEVLSQLQQHIQRQLSRRNSTPRPQSDLFEQYTRVLQTVARQKPILLALDDLQWADVDSLNLLFHLGRQIGDSRILVLGAYRPAEVAIGYGGERHPLEPIVNEFKRLFGAIEIDLSQAEGYRFIDDWLDTEPNCLDEAFRQTLHRQTGGHPLFTLELVRGMQERGDLIQDQEGRWVEGAMLDWETLPARVEAIIAERIGRLPAPLQDILTIASVEGETFTAEVIAQVSGTSQPEVVHCLSDNLERTHRLVLAQGIEQRGEQYFSSYRFRHFLFQKYLYSRLDPAERVYLHNAVGLALEQLYGETAGEVAVQLVRHFQEAGQIEKAIDYLRQAGDRVGSDHAHLCRRWGGRGRIASRR